MAGIGNETGQEDWLDVDSPESRARESLKYFEHTVMVSGLPFRAPLCQPGQARGSSQEVEAVGGCVIIQERVWEV